MTRTRKGVTHARTPIQPVLTDHPSIRGRKQMCSFRRRSYGRCWRLLPGWPTRRPSSGSVRLAAVSSLGRSWRRRCRSPLLGWSATQTSFTRRYLSQPAWRWSSGGARGHLLRLWQGPSPPCQEPHRRTMRRMSRMTNAAPRRRSGGRRKRKRGRGMTMN